MSNSHPAKPRLFRRSVIAGAAGLMAAHKRAAVAQPDFRNRPIRLLFPAQPGGPGDVLMRAITAIASRQLGRPIVMDYRAGASGMLAARALLNAQPDGHTLGAMTITAFRMPLLAPSQAGFDPRTDFTWIIQLTGLLIGLVVRADSPWLTFRQFLNHAQANPGRVTFGFPGPNTTELPLKIIARDEGIEWTPVPFQSGAESLRGLLGGHVDAVADTSSWIPYVRDGSLRLLVTYGHDRAVNFPDVPTLREFGIHWPVDAAGGIAGPHGMDRDIVRALHDAFHTALYTPAVMHVLERFDMSIRYLGSEQYAVEARRLYAQEREVLLQLGHIATPE